MCDPIGSIVEIRKEEGMKKYSMSDSVEDVIL